MIPKVEVVAVPSDITKSKLVEVFRDSGLTRLPVFKDTLDTPKGMIHLKDFALRHGFNGSGERFSMNNMLRPLLYAPPSMPIGVLLQKMQSDRMHMALVIDEYGGVDGLVTIEDLIEQVIGEIEDEHDAGEEQSFVEEAPGCFLAKARTPIEDFEKEIGQKLLLRRGRRRNRHLRRAGGHAGRSRPDPWRSGKAPRRAGFRGRRRRPAPHQAAARAHRREYGQGGAVTQTGQGL